MSCRPEFNWIETWDKYSKLENLSTESPDPPLFRKLASDGGEAKSNQGRPHLTPQTVLPLK